MGWFRFYDTALDDPKVQRLKPQIFMDWVNILCLASRSDGIIPPIKDVAFGLRVSKPQAAFKLKILELAGLLDSTEAGFEPHNWKVRQYKSDVSTDRVKRFRKRRETVSGNAPEQNRTEVGVTKEVTPPKTKESFVEGNGFDPDALVAIWNEIMEGILPKVIRMTQTRKDHLRNRMEDTFAGEITQWRAYLERIKASPLLRGETGRESWRGATFDWATNLTNALKVLEGNYDEMVDGRANTPYEDALAKWFGAGEPPDEKPRPEDYQ